MTTQLPKNHFTRRSFFAVPGAAALALLGAKKASACTVLATCIGSTDTTVTLRVTFGAACGTLFPDRIRVTGEPGGIGPVLFAADPDGTTDITITGLDCRIQYVFQVTGLLGELFSDTTEVSSCIECQSRGCTRTQGYWKTHPEVWNGVALSLGNPGTIYSQAQLLSIFNAPVRGNGLLSLAHQLIAAKLNVLAGATSPAAVAAITAADNMIGSLVIPPIGAGYLSPDLTSAAVTALDNFNNGLSGPLHCAG